MHIPCELGMAAGALYLWDVCLCPVEITEQTLVTCAPWIPRSKIGTTKCRICQHCAKPFCLTVLQINSSTRSLVLDGGFDKTNYPAPDAIWLNCTAFVATPRYSAGQRFAHNPNKIRWGFTGSCTRWWFCQHKACYSNPSLVQQWISSSSDTQHLSWSLPHSRVAGTEWHKQCPDLQGSLSPDECCPANLSTLLFQIMTMQTLLSYFFPPNKNHFNRSPEYEKVLKMFQNHYMQYLLNNSP